MVIMRPTFASVAGVALLALGLTACDKAGPATGDGGDTDAGVGDMAMNAFTISPPDQVVVVRTGQPAPTLTYTSTFNGQSVPSSFVLDRGELGSLDGQSGVFVAGSFAGKGHVTATYQGMTAATTLTVQQDIAQTGDPAYTGGQQLGGPGGYGGVGGDGPGGPTNGTQDTTLGSTPTPDATVKLLYPYDGTVFPRGLLAPLIMWNPGGHNFDAVRITMQSKSGNYHYVGNFAKPAGGRPFTNLPLPGGTWTQMNFSASGEEVTITLTFAEGTTSYGPYSRKWLIAPATLKGTVYYNSYGTSLLTNYTGKDSQGRYFGGGILGIHPGDTDPVVVAGANSPVNGTGDVTDDSGCRVCHSVSAKGNRLVTALGSNYSRSSTVDLIASSETNLVATSQVAFSALSPDGNWLFSNSYTSANSAPPDTTSRLYDLTTTPPGALATGVNGLPADLQAALPSFSPDGKHVIFNRFGGAGGDGRSLGLIDFDAGSKTFSMLRTAFTPAAGGAVAWPSFFPTSSGAVFEIETDATQYGETRNGNHGKLWWIDLASGMTAALDKLNGVGYLPVGADVPGSGTDHDDDTRLNYEPTANPIASGGFVWVVFTSRRMYGNVATLAPFISDPRAAGYDYKTQYTTKKLWVAALDLNAAPGTDPSHPAFYLPAQEIHAGNARGFWTTEPCRMDNTSCESGDECCGGYCRGGGDGGALTCTSVLPVCAQLSERCNQDSDCCPNIDGAITCVNNLCVQSIAPIP